MRHRFLLIASIVAVVAIHPKRTIAQQDESQIRRILSTAHSGAETRQAFANALQANRKDLILVGFQNTDPGVRVKAVDCIKQLSPQDAADAFILILQDDSVWRVSDFDGSRFVAMHVGVLIHIKEAIRDTIHIDISDFSVFNPSDRLKMIQRIKQQRSP